MNEPRIIVLPDLEKEDRNRASRQPIKLLDIAIDFSKEFVRFPLLLY